LAVASGIYWAFSVQNFIQICSDLTFLLHDVQGLVFTLESSYCYQRVLAIAILSVRLSVTRVDQSKAVQVRITKSLPSAA